MKHFAIFEVFTVVMIQIEVFWVVTPYSDVVGYRRFGRLCCLHHHFIPEDRDTKPVLMISANR
jgi:hypothetical protein